MALLVVAVLGCSSKSSNNGHDAGGTTDGATGDGSGSCSPTCAVTTPTCGVYEACGQAIDCGMCAFGSSAMPYASSALSPASAPSGAIEIAYVPLGSAGVHVAHDSGGSWSDEVAVAAPGTGSATAPVLAIAPGGTRWLEYSLTSGGSGTYVTSAAEGSAWGSAAQIGGSGQLAVGSDGTPFVLYTNSQNELEVASWSGSAWTSSVVTQSSASPVAFAVSGTQPVVAFDADTGGELAQLSGSSWNMTAIPGLSSVNFFDGALGLAADGSGDIAVIAETNNGPAVQILSGTTWTMVPVPLGTLPDDFSQVTFSIISDSHGTFWITTVDNGETSYLVNVTPQGTPVQRIFQNNAGVLQAVPDLVNGVALVQGATVLTRSGDVSTASGSACAEIVTSMCESACHTCITGSLCSWSWSVMNSTTNAGGNTFGSAADCAFSLTATLCGDIDSSGSALGSCVSALPATCVAPGGDCTDGCAEMPMACGSIYY